MELGLRGKRALVTGATMGIGEAIAMTLAAEGVAVAVNGRDQPRGNAVVEAIRAAGGTAVLTLGDVGTESGAKAVAANALEGLGGVDILINNAGGRAGEAGAASFWDVPSEDFVATYEKNVVAAMRLMRQLVPGMQERGWGRVIQIASGIAFTPTGTLPDYAAAKAAMVNMTLGAAKALANTGVTVNTVSPGMIETPSLSAWLMEVGKQQGLGDDRTRIEAFVLQNYVHQTVSRLGRVADVADLVTYVASARADFVTGADLRVDGGASPSIN